MAKGAKQHESCGTHFGHSLLDDLRAPLFWRGVVAEALGTMLLVFVACGSCIEWTAESEKPNVVQIALAFGLGVGTVVWVIAYSSGGNVNPAVSLGLLVARKITIVRFFFYVVAQCGGAIAGAALLKCVTPSNLPVGSLGSTLVSETAGVTTLQALLIECIITFILVMTVFATIDPKRYDLIGSGPLAIGLSITFCHLFAIKYTGSSMNPARSLGPAVISGHLELHWVYWAGPMLGGLLAGILYENLFAANASLAKVKGFLLSSDYDNTDFDTTAAQKKPEDAEAAHHVDE